MPPAYDLAIHLRFQCYIYVFLLSIILMSLDTETVLATEEHHHFSMKSYWEECVDCGVLTTYKHVALLNSIMKVLKFCSHFCNYKYI